MKKAKLITSSAVVMTMVMSSIVPAFAYSKEETVYSKLKTNGSEKTTVVSEHLINDQNETSLDDQSSLKNILYSNLFVYSIFDNCFLNYSKQIHNTSVRHMQ